jgi:tellurite resistance protein
MLVAKADGRTAKAEKVVVRDHLGRMFASDSVALRFIDVEVEQADKFALNEADVIAAVQPFSPADRRELLDLANRIASAAGQVSAKEQQLLARLNATLGEPAPPRPPISTDPRHNPDLDAAFGAPAEAPPPPPSADLRHNPDLDAVFGV